MITAFLLAYWPERMEHFERIINDLRNGTIHPDRIVIWNNNRNFSLKDKFEGVETIESTENLGHRVRFVAALTFPSDYYFFIDDDITVGKKTIESYMKYAHPDCCFTHWGKVGGKNPGHAYTSGQEFASRRIKDPMNVEAIIGRGSIFASFNALVNMLVLEKELRTHPNFDDGREADIILGMANKSQVVPAEGHIRCVGHRDPEDPRRPGGQDVHRAGDQEPRTARAPALGLPARDAQAASRRVVPRAEVLRVDREDARRTRRGRRSHRARSSRTAHRRGRARRTAPATSSERWRPASRSTARCTSTRPTRPAPST